MSLRTRKFIVLATIIAIVVLASAESIACWLQGAGITGFAQHVRSEYATGTAITVILVLLFLLGGPNVIGRCARFIRRCPVCDHAILRPGKYCGSCGSRVA